MDNFWYIAGGMILLALGFLLPPLLRRVPAKLTRQADAEIEVFRERLRELQDDLRRGALEPQSYAVAERELQTALLEAGQHFHTEAHASGRHYLAAVSLLLLLPAFSFFMYQQFGSHDQVISAAQQEAQAQQQIEDLRKGIAHLETLLEKQPNDKKMWHMLGRAQLELKDYAKAYFALERAAALDGNDAEILLDKVLALAGMQDPLNTTEQQRLIEQVLQKQPDSQRGLWVASLVAMEQAHYAQAREYLQRLLALLPADDKNTEIIHRQLAALDQQASAAETAETAADSPEQAAADSNAQITVDILVDPGIVPKVSADDLVYVFARAKSGPKMPLAAVQVRVKDLPKTVVLNGQTAPVPAVHLSTNKEEIVVGARISRSGRPEGQTGDFEGYAADAVRLTAEAPAATVKVVINSIRP